MFSHSQAARTDSLSGMGEWQCGIGDIKGTPMFGSCYADPTNAMPFFLVLEGFATRGLKLKGPKHERLYYVFTLTFTFNSYLLPSRLINSANNVFMSFWIEIG